METRANYIAVGFFTLIAVITVFAVIFWFGRYGEDDNLVPMDIRIRGSVSGLGPASVVQFNGIDVGRVDGLSLDAADPRYVIIHVLVNRATPVRADTTASIGIRGLSGGAYIQLEGGSPTATPLLSEQADPESIPLIAGDPSALSDLMTRVNQIAGQTERVMATLETFVQANNETVSRTLTNAETFSRALAENSEGIEQFMASAGDVAQSLQGLSEKLDGSLTRAEEILTAIDPKSVGNSLENVEAFTKSLADQREQIAAVVDTVNNTAKQLDKFTGDLNATLGKVDGVVSAIDREVVIATVANINKSAERAEQILSAIEGENLNNAVTEFQSAAAQARKILDSVDEAQVKSLVDDLGKASSDVSELVAAIDAAKINSAVDNFSTAAEGAQTIVGDVAKVTGPLGERAGDIDRIVADVQNAAARASNILDNIDEAQVKSLVSDLSKASSDVSQLVAAIDADTINSAVSNFSTAAEGAQTIVGDVAKVTGPLGARADDIDRIVSDVQSVASQARTILDSVDETQVKGLLADLSQASNDVSKLVAAIDAAKINKAVDNISSAAEGAQTIVGDVAKVTGPLGERAADIDQIVSDATELASRLNASSTRVDDILNQVSSFVGSDATSGVMTEIRTTLAQFRRTAANFDRQIASVAGNVNSFTKRGLADTQGLIRDARQSLNRFDRVMRNLQSNPSSLLTGAGGSNVRESSGSRIRR
ncbi:MAG: MlaD family protein [Rhizobiaceae bacterium]